MRPRRQGNATPETFYPKLVETFGAGGIAWGSNYPASPRILSDPMTDTMAASSFLSGGDLDLVMGGTAAR